MKEKGVWRTIKGRHIFIKDGQTIRQALKDSEKYKEEVKERFKKYQEDKNNKNNKNNSLDPEDVDTLVYDKLNQEEEEYELYKKAYEYPESIDPMTEWSTDWAALSDKYSKRYQEEKNSKLLKNKRTPGYENEDRSYAGWELYSDDPNRFKKTEDYISKKEFKEATKIDDALDRAIMMQAADDVGKTLNDDDIRFRAEHYIRNNYNGNATDDEIFEKLRNEYKNRGWYEPTNNNQRNEQHRKSKEFNELIYMYIEKGYSEQTARKMARMYLKNRKNK